MGEACIPTADLSPFVREDEDGKKKAMEAITQACSEYGFFQIVNHGVSLDLIKEAMQPSKTFFDYSDEEKSKSSPSTNAPLPAGYSKQPLHSPDKNEYFLFFPPGSSFPSKPSQVQMVKGEGKSGKVVDSIPSTSVYELNWVKTKPLNTSVNMISVDVQIYIISIMHADVRWIG
ncbi:hypothetical protein D0Y65_015155 [Glycine soja]|uniref:Non-haem dioxygenase N-terminal domain-containing protein n=1 Tax=Glycine soja TaxID=3848 RepID=A0A445KBY9_GLYSO|nr:hypothetical protein D0Y65_015155 [Glycine soja]